MSLRERLAQHRVEPRQGQHESPGLLPGGGQRLVERFIVGQTWLAVAREALDTQADAGVGSALERRYLAGLDKLVAVENVLRFTYEFEGCARGVAGPCDPAPVLRCEACVPPR